MLVVATAGHVDHGKSTLVRALTGTEPDRWAEERRRGMTIDLGHAWTQLPGGRVVAFVDVPGHARFIGNMLAGLGPAPAVMVVVAADEGWRRQSGEHLAAVDALGLTTGLLVVTRSDLADPAPATRQALDEIARSSLGSVPSVAVSGATGQGLDDLRAALAALPQEAPDLAAPVRLWVDRSFTVKGAGTVVTGTLAAGSLRVGDVLRLGDETVTVRGLQSLGSPADRVDAVARVAVNLRGAPEVGRGDALLTGAWTVTDTVDVSVGTDLPAQLLLHVGTAVTPVTVRPLGDGAARLRLARGLPLAVGDRMVLRDPAEQRVVAGVTVLDTAPPPLRRRGAAAARAAELAAGPVRPVDVVRRAPARVEALAVDDPAVQQVAGWHVHDDTWQQWTGALLEAVDAHTKTHPLDPGLTALPLLPDPALLAPLAQAAGLEVHQGRVRRRGTLPDLGPAAAAVQEVVARLTASEWDVPEAPDLAALGLGVRELAAAEMAGHLLRLAPEVVVLPQAPARAMRVLAGLEQPFTLSQARQALGTTRRVAVPLLEHLDRRGWTRRLPGDVRRVAD